MQPTRVLAAIAALTCAAAMTVAGWTEGASAAPQQATARASAGTPLPAHVFAPYYLNPADTLAATSRASGARYITLAFLQTAKPGSCTVDWNGSQKQPVGTYAKGIAAVQAEGGNVVPSFGGASADSAQEELADSCTSVPAIAAQYEKVIETYHVTRLDLDTEENSLNNYAGIDRRNKAIAMVERWAAKQHRVVQFVYTIPTNTTGPDQGGSYVLQNAVANGAQIAIVNVMTFDYYDNLPHEIGDETEGAAIQIYNRLNELFPGKTAAQLWGMIGVTEDLGVDDFGPAETFTLADAHTVEHWAAAKGLAELSFWNLQDDNTAGSHVKQNPYEYSHILEPFTSSASVSTARLAEAGSQAGAVDPQRGNMRSVSCPAATFCMAVDQSGNNALSWNGTTWSAPASIDPGGTRAELNSVSCASTSFCVAVDTLGRALAWNGTRWTAPEHVAGIGLTSVSCPSSGFCAAVDGIGDALTFNGGSWSTRHIDRSGSALQSVSCASSTFCAAGDWDGNVYTFNGESWSAPRAVDPSGGGISSMSCPSSSFCEGTDWNGGAVTWNGATWTLKTSFDSNAAGGLMSVSCQSSAFCMAVDGSGDYLTWNGVKWSSPVMIDLTGDGLESVSCGSPSSCVAVDWNGNALVYNGTRWTVPAISCPDSSTSSAGKCYTRGSSVDPRTGVPDSVSCPTSSFCAAVDQNGSAITGPARSTAGAVSTIDPIAGILTSVSCPTSAFCMAVDTNGYALSWHGTAWSVPVWSASSPADKRGPLESVSCTSRTFCMAVDGNGNALRWNGRSWSAPAPTGASELTSVSCSSESFCAAVDAHGDMLMWNASRWLPAATAEPGGFASVSCAGQRLCAAVGTGGAFVLTRSGTAAYGSALGIFYRLRDGLTAVSCRSARYCVAVGSSGGYVTWNGRTWSAAVQADPAGGGLTGISCPARGACVATDFTGHELRLP
jgi:Glycosyl hydrolases family 18